MIIWAPVLIPLQLPLILTGARFDYEFCLGTIPPSLRVQTQTFSCVRVLLYSVSATVCGVYSRNAQILLQSVFGVSVSPDIKEIWLIVKTSQFSGPNCFCDLYIVVDYYACFSLCVSYVQFYPIFLLQLGLAILPQIYRAFELKAFVFTEAFPSLHILNDYYDNINP